MKKHGKDDFCHFMPVKKGGWVIDRKIKTF
jgi:hypothetical protein